MFLISINFNNITDIALVIGATTNTIVGFCLPAIFYLKLDSQKNGNKCSWRRFGSHLINILFIGFSLGVFVNYINSKF